MNEQLDETTLRAILLECLNDAEAAAQDEEPQKGAKGGLFSRRKPRRVPVTPDEVALAARFIVERFGDTNLPQLTEGGPLVRPGWHSAVLLGFHCMLHMLPLVSCLPV